MFTKKKISWYIFSIMIIFIVIYIGFGVFDYLEYRSVANAVGGMPWQDGGEVIKSVLCLECFDPLTDLCDDAAVPLCPCIEASLVYGPLCVNYVEITTNSQYGTTAITPPVEFVYSGGGAFPEPGMQYLAGGASQYIPWIIGIPGPIANKFDKLKNWFYNFIIAGK